MSLLFNLNIITFYKQIYSNTFKALKYSNLTYNFNSLSIIFIYLINYFIAIFKLF